MKLLILLSLFCVALAKDLPKQESTNKVMADGEDTREVYETYNGNQYIFYPTCVNWAQAHNTCLAIGAHLVVVNDRAEEAIVQRLAKGEETWIGLSNAQQFGLLFWINSEPLCYTNWCRGQPDNKGGNQKCVLTNFPEPSSITGSEKFCWDDQECEHIRTFVCERESGEDSASPNA